MADDVIVEIGAKIDQLISAVDQVKSKVNEIGTSSGKVASEMGAVWGNAMLEIGKKIIEAGEKLARFIEQAAELGERTENLSRQLGVSVENIGELSAMATATGSNLESMAFGVERMMVTIQRSERDAFNPATQALHRLGLSAADFKGLNADQALLKLANASSQFNQNIHMSTTLMDLGGRQMRNLMGIIGQGGLTYEEFKKKVQEAGGTLDKTTTHNLDELNTSIVILKAGLSGLGAAFVGAFGPLVASAIDIVAKGVGKVVEAIRFLRDVAKYGPDRGKGRSSEEDDGKPDVGGDDAAARLRLQIRALGIEKELAQETAKYERMKLGYEADLATYRITEEQKVAASGAANVRIAKLEAIAAEDKQRGWPKQSIEWAKAEKDRVIATEKVQTEIKKSQTDVTKVVAAEWATVGNTISSAMTASMRGLLEGTITWGDAFKKILEDLIIKIIEAIVQMEILAALEAATGTIGASAPSTILKSVIPHFAEGTARVPQTQLAMVHKGEMVIPSGMADMIRSGQGSVGNSSTNNVSFAISALDGASFAQWLRGGGGRMLSKSIAEHWNQNGGMRPAY